MQELAEQAKTTASIGKEIPDMARLQEMRSAEANILSELMPRRADSDSFQILASPIPQVAVPEHCQTEPLWV
jgi:hypothetical protein